ncbi:MAG: hypothetical protein EBU73_10160, partial [Chitinophagia bacterium]|nr:hypothetical protein [Chitinophagia bacterium]
RENGTCYIAVFCGFGKTHLGSYLSSQLGYQTLILSHRKMISNAWNETIKQVFGLEPITFEEHLKGKFSPIVVGSAIKVGKTDPKKLLCFGTVIVDEAVYFCTPQYILSVLRTTPKYLVGMCAEWERQDGLHKMLPYFFGEQKKYIIRINEKPFHVFRYQTNIKPPMRYQRFTGKLDWNAIVEYLSNHPERNKMICNICSIFAKNKILILCKRIEQCDTLYQMLSNSNESVSTLYGSKDSFYSSRVLVSTYSKVSVGFDDKNTCIDFDGQRLDLLILATDTENVEQAVGRVMRTAEVPRIIDIVDDFSSLTKHWKVREKFYKTRNGVISEEAIMFKSA